VPAEALLTARQTPTAVAPATAATLMAADLRRSEERIATTCCLQIT
jgi:hypothetical protein